MLANKARFDRDELEIYFGQSAVKFLPEKWQCEGVTTDSREIINGNLFIALVGENGDGHNYIDIALEKGAVAVVVSNQWFKEHQHQLTGKPVVAVKDTLSALGKLANIHRRRFTYPVLAIGGANGKTTTKNMTVELVSQKYKVLGTYKNFNNRIGVPLMLLQMNENFEVVVLEIGTNEPGEIAILSDISEPTHGLITNIGREHLEKLIDLDGVEMEETFLFGFLHKTNGIAFVNYDDERLRKYQKLLEDEVTFGTTDDQRVMIQGNINLDENLNPDITFTASDRKFNVKMKTCGYASALNAIAAAVAGFHFGLSDEEIIKGLSNYEPESGMGYGRMLVEKNNDYIIINDCYNANPESMTVALNNLSAIKGNHKIAVLADMRELGDSTEIEHQSLLELAIEKADCVMIFGNEMRKAYYIVKNDKIKYFETKQELVSELSNSINAGDVVLVKGSRGLAMEEVVNELKK